MTVWESARLHFEFHQNKNPPHKNIVMKRNYLDERATAKSGLQTGSKWYELQAFKTVSQSIGRVIRHNQDYGAVILLDCRYNHNNAIKSLSKWIIPHIKAYRDPETAANKLSQFFASNSKSISAKPIRTSCKNELQSETHMQAGPSTYDYLHQKSQISPISFSQSCPQKTDKATVPISKKRKRTIKMVSNTSPTDQQTDGQCAVDYIEIKPGMP